MNDYATTTSKDFGEGRANTKTMIEKWNNEYYGKQRSSDMWGVIQTEVGDIKNPTWFVPSRAEWGAFGDNLGITSDNYQDYGLSNDYWSSSQSDTRNAWYANVNDGGISYFYVFNDSYYVRLSATF